MKGNENQKVERAILTDLLRVLFSFEVVLCHYWSNGVVELWNKPFWALRSYAVPVFMLLSFYLNAHHFAEGNSIWLKKRLKRLWIPHMIWALIYYIALKVLEIMFSGELCNRHDLFWQILTGHSFNVAMWFQLATIVLTCIVYVILRKCKTFGMLVFVMFIAVALQYTNINYELFNGLRYELSYPLGRIAECAPLAVMGLIMAYCPKLKLEKLSGLLRTLFISFGAIWMGRMLLLPSGFGYQGLTAIGVAIIFVAITTFLDTKILFPVAAKNICAKVSRYTFGIYCLHNLVGRCITVILKKYAAEYAGSFEICILIYVLCFIACAIIDRIPLRITKILVN